MTTPTWTPATEAKLRALYPNNHPTVLAKIFGTTPADIRAKAMALGLSKP
jgi:hypothetical protein